MPDHPATPEDRDPSRLTAYDLQTGQTLDDRFLIVETILGVLLLVLHRGPSPVPR